MVMNFAWSFIRPWARQCVLLFLLVLSLWYSPFVDFPIRVFTLMVALLILVELLFCIWRFRTLRWTLITLYAASAAFFLFPSHLPENRSDLRASYCNALNSYVGCRYFWGGVSYFGIDCSGLVQKGLEDGLVTRGLLTLNPSLVREG